MSQFVGRLIEGMMDVMGREDVTWGHRVLEVQPKSPASECGLVPYLDFVVDVDGEHLDGGSRSLAAVMRGSKNKEVSLGIYNIKSQERRTAKVTPRTGWGGRGLLGVVARFDFFFRAGARASGKEPSYDRALPVVEVRAGSEAAKVGIVAGEDWVLGTEQVGFTQFRDVVVHLFERRGEDVIFQVYNAKSDTVRPVVIHVDEGELVEPAPPAGSSRESGLESGWQFGMLLVSGARGTIAPGGLQVEFEDEIRSKGPGTPIDQAPDAVVERLCNEEWKTRMELTGSVLARTVSKKKKTTTEDEGSGEAEGGGGDGGD